MTAAARPDLREVKIDLCMVLVLQKFSVALAPALRQANENSSQASPQEADWLQPDSQPSAVGAELRVPPDGCNRRATALRSTGFSSVTFRQRAATRSGAAEPASGCGSGVSGRQQALKRSAPPGGV
jgi:hypothetical protein